MKLYTKIENKTNLYEFLKEGFTTEPIYDHYIREYSLVKFVETYKDKACEIRECKPARRSMEDLISISQTVFPEVTEKDVIDIIFQLHDNEIGVECLFCPDIMKFVFYLSPYGRNRLKRTNINYANQKGGGKYSLTEIYAIAKRDPATTRKYEELYPLKIN